MSWTLSDHCDNKWLDNDRLIGAADRLLQGVVQSEGGEGIELEDIHRPSLLAFEDSSCHTATRCQSSETKFQRRADAMFGDYPLDN